MWARRHPTNIVADGRRSRRSRRPTGRAAGQLHTPVHNAPSTAGRKREDEGVHVRRLGQMVGGRQDTVGQNGSTRGWDYRGLDRAILGQAGPDKVLGLPRAQPEARPPPSRYRWNCFPADWARP